jgi:hypothetical protein
MKNCIKSIATVRVTMASVCGICKIRSIAERDIAEFTLCKK